MVGNPREMVELQKLFKSKFKQQALDGDSKYAKMNLEDSNPDNLPPPLRICALTIVQIKEFRTNIPIIYQDVGDVNVSLLDRRARTLLNNLNSFNRRFKVAKEK